MEISVVFLVLVLLFLVWFMITFSRKKKFLEETIARRKKFLETIGPDARAIVNNGLHFFFVDDTQECFGIDESGATYSYEGLQSVRVYRDSISFTHENYVTLCVGKEYTGEETTYALPTNDISAIAELMLPIVQKNLHKRLATYGISPTYEYEHEGTFWGCDMESKVFYSTFSSVNIYDFSCLNRITVEDMTNNSLYDGNYIIHLYIESDIDLSDDEFELTFYSRDTKFYKLLDMFKAIRKRQ